jgi:hypothetical protein
VPTVNLLVRGPEEVGDGIEGLECQEVLEEILRDGDDAEPLR